MKTKLQKIRTDIYDIETEFAKQQLMLEIIRDFGIYSAEKSDEVEKMTYLINILRNQQNRFQKALDKFIPGFQKSFRKR